MKGFSRIFALFFVLFVFLYPIPSTLTPSYAAVCPTPPYPNGVPIGDCFGFGGYRSLGEITSNLVMPTFSIAATLVVIYFFLGAFKYLRSGGNKEEVAGARQMITQAIVGFIILIFAFLILQFLLSSLFGINSLPLFQP